MKYYIYCSFASFVMRHHHRVPEERLLLPHHYEARQEPFLWYFPPAERAYLRSIFQCERKYIYTTTLDMLKLFKLKLKRQKNQATLAYEVIQKIMENSQRKIDCCILHRFSFDETNDSILFNVHINQNCQGRTVRGSLTIQSNIVFLSAITAGFISFSNLMSCNLHFETIIPLD